MASEMLVYGAECVFACPTDTFLDPTETQCVKTCPKYTEIEDFSGLGQSAETRKCVCPKESVFDAAQNACVRTSLCEDYVRGVHCLQATECTGLGLFLQNVDGEKECVETCASGYVDESLQCVEACPRFFVEADGQTRCVSQCPEELSFHEESGRCVAVCAQKAAKDRSCVKATNSVYFIAAIAAAACAVLVAGIVVGVVCCKLRKQTGKAKAGQKTSSA